MPEYQTEIAACGRSRGSRYRITATGAPLATADVLAGLRADDPAFREHFISVLHDAPFEACFWETPPVSATTHARPWEFVQLDAPSLSRVPADERAFAEHFESGAGVAAFPNLGADAWLVAPCPEEPTADYAHLASFSRTASTAQQHALWRRVGEEMTRHLSGEPLWLNTCGTGIYWLHVRLDRRPKYYSHAAYRTFAP